MKQLSGEAGNTYKNEEFADQALWCGSGGRATQIGRNPYLAADA